MAVPWSLQVNRKSLARALRRVCILAGKGASGDVTVALKDSYLEIAFGEAAISVEAQGSWPEPVHVPAVFIRKLPRALPAVEILTLTVRANRFYADRLSVPCRDRQPSEEQTSALAEMIHKDSDLFDVLVVGSRFSREELEEAGVLLLHEAAISRLYALCTKAAQILCEYGVKEADLVDLCLQHIEDGTRTMRQSDGRSIHLVAQVWEMLATLGVEPREVKGLMDGKLRNSWKR